jgi:transposase InsO family protein
MDSLSESLDELDVQKSAGHLAVIHLRSGGTAALERWIVFLRNHRGAIAAMDFFTVPTVAFRVLHVWFAIDHARRRILHFDITELPIADWVRSFEKRSRWKATCANLVFDRDASFGERVASMVESLGLRPTRTAYRSRWQNGIAERWIGSVRRELLDHVVVFNERHLRRLLNEYVAYYHDDRTHDALAKGTPAGRRPAVLQVPYSTTVSRPRLGGLHHRYEAAA